MTQGFEIQEPDFDKLYSATLKGQHVYRFQLIEIILNLAHTVASKQQMPCCDILNQLIKFDLTPLHAKLPTRVKERKQVIWNHLTEAELVRNEEGIKKVFNKYVE